MSNIQGNNTVTPPWVIHEKVDFTPLGSNVVVIVEDTERRTPGGLLLPTRDREAALIARVVSVGPKVTHIQQSDRVLFERYAGTAIRSTDKPAILVIDQADIMAVLTPAKGGCFCGAADRAPRTQFVEAGHE